jgi:hypothetical protein
MDRHRVTVAIPERTAEQLAELANAHYRVPKQEAAVLLIDAIERAAHEGTDDRKRQAVPA